MLNTWPSNYKRVNIGNFCTINVMNQLVFVPIKPLFCYEGVVLILLVYERPVLARLVFSYR